MTKIAFLTHIIDLIKKLYENQETTVGTNCGDTEWFKIGRGARQGCIMSPTLYNISAEDIMREVLQNYDGGVKIRITRELLKQLKEIISRIGLFLSTKKTKIMVVDSNRVDTEEFMLGEEKIEELDNFVYLEEVQLLTLPVKAARK